MYKSTFKKEFHMPRPKRFSRTPVPRPPCKPLQQPYRRWPLNEDEYAERNRRRQSIAYEDEVARRILQAVSRLDIHDRLARYIGGFDEWPVLTIDALYDDPDFENFPMRLQFRNREYQAPEPGIVKLLHMFPGTMIAKCLSDDWDPDEDLDYEGFGLIVPYGGRTVVIHNRPDLAKGPAIRRHRCGSGCRLAMHRFEPFIDDLAEECRVYMASERGREEIESNADWRESSWEDHE